MKLRINAVDFNLTKPLNEFDDMYCPFSNLPLKSVPVIRIFGKLFNGQNACAHVHGIFPYFFIEYNHNINPTQVRDYIHQLGLSINQSLAISLRRDFSDKASTTQFVRAIIICKGTPFYGYHVGSKPFLKIILKDPKHIPRLVQLMESGQLMNTHFQVFESHIPYVLQFFTDYNLYGCDWLNVSQARYRLPLPDPPLVDWHGDSTSQYETINSSNIDSNLIHDASRDSNCAVEFDVRASWIKNRHSITPRYIHNNLYEKLGTDEKLLPSLRELWRNEEERRKSKGLSPSIKIQNSVKGDRHGESYYPKWDLLDDLKLEFEERLTNNKSDNDNDSYFNQFTEESKLLNVFETTEALYHSSERRRKDSDNEGSNIYLEISSSQPTDDIEPVISQQLRSQRSKINTNNDSFVGDLKLNRSLISKESTSSSNEGSSLRQLTLSESMASVQEKKSLKRENTLGDQSNEASPTNKKFKDSNSISVDSDSDLDAKEFDDLLMNLSQSEIVPGVTVGMLQDSMNEKTPSKISKVQISSPKILTSSQPTLPSSMTLRNEAFSNRSQNFYLYNLPPPSTTECIKSLRENSLPSKVYRDPYYSNPNDIPQRPREYAGRIYVLKGDVIPEWNDGAKTNKNLNTLSNSLEYSIRPPSRREVLKNFNDTFNANKLTSDKKYLNSQIEGPPSHQKIGLIPDPSANANNQTREHDINVTNLTVLIIEVFAKSQKNLLPNPQKNQIESLFYYFKNSNDEIETGSILVEKTENLKPSLSSYNVEYVVNEADIIFTLIDKVQAWDPDIIGGWDTELGSWGYLADRTRIEIGLELSEEVSRVRSKSHRNIIGTERWAEMKTTTFASPGRHVFNVWRIAKSELSLPQTTLEHVSHKVLKQRFPKYSYETLSKWWDSNNASLILRVIRTFSSKAIIVGDILDKLEIVTKTAEFARTIGVDFYSVISRGSQYKVEAIMFRIAKPENYVLISPNRNQVGSQNAIECFPLVMEPDSSYYKDPVVVLDFQSLYPSIILAYNYCYSTCLGRIKPFQNGYKFGFVDHTVSNNLLEILKDDIAFSPNGLMFVKPHVRQSLLSKMLAELLDTRVMIRQAMAENRHDKKLIQLLHARQLSLKLMANVTYGYTSASFSGRMPSVELADSIVQTGRETLEKAINLIHSTTEWGAKVVYGDTDSLFVCLPGRTQQEAFEIGSKISETVTKSNPKPIKLKFEKMYLPCVLMAKKRYVGNMFERVDDREGVFEAKGIETVRRDGIPAQAKMVETSLKILFNSADLSQVKEYCQRQWNKIIQQKVSIQDFTFAKEVRLGTYSTTAVPLPGVMVATKMMWDDPRAEAHYGERIPYVITEGPQSRQVDRAVRPEEMLTNSQLRLDAKYYIERVLIPPLERIFNLIGADINSWYLNMPRKYKSEVLKPFLRDYKDTNQNQRRYIQQYIRSIHCETCGQSSIKPICEICDSDSNVSNTLFKLMNRKFDTTSAIKDLHIICASCSGFHPSESVPCINLDCNLLYKKCQTNHQIDQMEGMDGIIQDLSKRLEW